MNDTLATQIVGVRCSFSPLLFIFGTENKDFLMKFTSCLVLIFFTMGFLIGQTTGKITGTIKDSETNEALIGVNVIVQGTYSGAATDVDGAYYILNIKPGTYTLIIDMIGYKQVKMENVRISVNRTSNINVDLVPTVIQGETVVVEDKKYIIGPN